MDDEKAEIKKTIRMGPSDYQSLVDYSEDHPELGGESNIIRTAIKEYINRDARSTPGSDNETGIFIPLTETVLTALRVIKGEGLFRTEEDFVIDLLNDALNPKKQGAYSEAFVTAQTLQKIPL
ncbi:MAG: hypothetical protein FWG19_01890 [Methanomassiliicoccaceae archaeon]|nr:hypothetical protein [Methanomassiliicoccaceae archaeon]